MSRSIDPATRATRDAAIVSAASVVVYAVLWLLSTQVDSIRAISPFSDDPWDAFASYAAIFLPVIAGATWIRSLGHREAVLPPVTARRIRWGSGLGSAIVLVAAGVDVQAIATVGYPSDAGAASVVLSALVGMSVVLTLAAVALGVRAAGIGRGATTVAGDEPDIVDDALALAVALVGTLGVGRSPVKRAVDAVESFLDRSPLSPRRHRWMFGVVAAVVIAVAFVLWHALREGPWINASAALIVGTLFGAGVLAVYLGTVGPLRLLRPPRQDDGRRRGAAAAPGATRQDEAPLAAR